MTQLWYLIYQLYVSNIPNISFVERSPRTINNYSHEYEAKTECLPNCTINSLVCKTISLH